jgi:UDP-glucose 4-epimerase
MQSLLVTGGAGYIGSHIVRQLTERNERVVVLDNLSTGYRSAVLNAPLVVGDTAIVRSSTECWRNTRSRR